MTAFRHPAFAKLLQKICRATRELEQIEKYLSAHSSEMSLGEWGATTAVSLGIHHVYNGVEDVLLSLANDVDGLVPDRKSVVQGKSVSVRVDLGGRRSIKKKKQNK